jgi:hypothetical protein
MKLQIGSVVDMFLGFMLLVKFVFLISAVGHVITVKSKNPKIKDQETWVGYISDTSEMIFIFGMSFFLIYYFSPNRKTYVIQKETAILLFAYGIVMLVAAVKRYHLTPSRKDLPTPEKKSPSNSPAPTPQPLSN